MEVITDGIGLLLGRNIAFDDADRQAAANALAEHAFLKPLRRYGFRFGYYSLTVAGMPFYRVYLVFPVEMHDETKYEGIGECLEVFLSSPDVVAFLDVDMLVALIDTTANAMPGGSSIEWAGALYLVWVTENRSFGQKVDPVPFPPYAQPASLLTYNALEEASIEHHVWGEESVAYWQAALGTFEKGKLLASICSDMFTLFVLAMALPFSESKTKMLKEFWATVQQLQAPQQ